MHTKPSKKPHHGCHQFSLFSVSYFSLALYLSVIGFFVSLTRSVGLFFSYASPFCSRITKVYEIYSHFDRFIASTIFLVFFPFLLFIFLFIQFTLITFTFALALNIIFLSLPLRSFYHIHKCTLCIVIRQSVQYTEIEWKKERQIARTCTLNGSHSECRLYTYVLQILTAISRCFVVVSLFFFSFHQIEFSSLSY